MERIRILFPVLVAIVALGFAACGGGDGGGGSVFAPPLVWGQNNWNQSAWQ